MDWRDEISQPKKNIYIYIYGLLLSRTKFKTPSVCFFGRLGGWFPLSASLTLSKLIFKIKIKNTYIYIYIKFSIMSTLVLF